MFNKNSIKKKNMIIYNDPLLLSYYVRHFFDNLRVRKCSSVIIIIISTGSECF